MQERRQDNRLSSYVTLDGVDYPLVPGSEVLAVPLNPFSPASQAGNSSRVVSQRHAVRVWDDFTTGIGYLDDNEEHGGFAFGNLDVRVPAQATVPTAAAASGTASGFTGTARLPRYVECLVNAGTYTFFAWDKYGVGGASTSIVKTFHGATVTNVALSSVGEVVQGIVPFGAYWFFLSTDPGANTSYLYRVSTFDPNTGALTYALRKTEAGKRLLGITVFDSKLIAWDAISNQFYQYDDTTNAWAFYVNGIPILPTADSVRQLFVWTDKSGNRDALYALTTARILVYDEDGQQWEPFYEFGSLFPAINGYCHVNRREGSLMFVPFHTAATVGGAINDVVLAFSPGAADNIQPNKNYGLPTEITFTGGGDGHMFNAPFALASGIHWLYAFTFAPTVGSVTGIGSAVFAHNEQGGWTQVWDAALANTGQPYSPLVGGGYGLGRMLLLTADGRWWDIAVPDQNVNHPVGTYEANRAYFLRSGRVWNNQRNVQKLLSHWEVQFAAIPSAVHTVYLKYRVWNGSGALYPYSPFTSSADLATGTETLVTVDTALNLPYRYLEWQLEVLRDSSVAVPPVVESVALYYTYYQSSHFAYSFSIDLSVETWAEFHPDGTFHGKSRGFLQQALLNLVDMQGYHTFSYNRYTMRESVGRVDMLLTRREEADNGGGVYPTTCRDLDI